MKIKAIKPIEVKLEITFESQTELDFFATLFNLTVINDLKLNGLEMKDAVYSFSQALQDVGADRDKEIWSLVAQIARHPAMKKHITQ